MYAVRTAGSDQNAKTAARMTRRNAGARKGTKTMKKNEDEVLKKGEETE